MTKATCNVAKSDLDRLHSLIGGRVWNALDLGLPLDDLDGQRIREALDLVAQMRAAA